MKRNYLCNIFSHLNCCIGASCSKSTTSSSCKFNLYRVILFASYVTSEVAVLRGITSVNINNLDPNFSLPFSFAQYPIIQHVMASIICSSLITKHEVVNLLI